MNMNWVVWWTPPVIHLILDPNPFCIWSASDSDWMKIFIKLPPHIKFCFKLGMEIFGRTQKGYLHFNSQGSMIYFQWNYSNQNMLSKHNFIFQACSFYPLFFFVTHQINPNPNPAQHPFVASFLAHVLFLTNMKHIYVCKSKFLNFLWLVSAGSNQYWLLVFKNFR